MVRVDGGCVRDGMWFRLVNDGYLIYVVATGVHHSRYRFGRGD